MRLDRDDRAALAKLGVWALLGALSWLTLIVTLVGVAVGVHLFRLIAGV
jgi:hypothetical protein